MKQMFLIACLIVTSYAFADVYENSDDGNLDPAWTHVAIISNLFPWTPSIPKAIRIYQSGTVWIAENGCSYPVAQPFSQTCPAWPNSVLSNIRSL